MEMVIYDSRANSGTTKHFARQLARLFNVPAISVQEITQYTEIKSYILCTYTIDYGAVPEDTKNFLMKHAANMLAVVANGSSNFRTMGLFGRAGDRISAQYEVELLGRLDMGGTREDLVHIAQRVEVLTQKAMQPISIEHVRPQSTFINGKFNLQSLV